MSLLELIREYSHSSDPQDCRPVGTTEGNVKRMCDLHDRCHCPNYGDTRMGTICSWTVNLWSRCWCTLRCSSNGQRSLSLLLRPITHILHSIKRKPRHSQSVAPSPQPISCSSHLVFLSPTVSLSERVICLAPARGAQSSALA